MGEKTNFDNILKFILGSVRPVRIKEKKCFIHGLPPCDFFCFIPLSLTVRYEF